MTTASAINQNRLATASSPYLHQHAGNPVHWQLWDEIALDHARESDTPILLSIGYSACHWCHVMAHGCFENSDIAAAMNASFVNIKLDREERPDIDHVYQLAHQALTGRGGGWPLTVFLDPQNLAPFYVGTYFPPTPGQGMPGFPEVLARVRAYFDTHRSDLRAQAEELAHWLRRVESAGDNAGLDADTANAQALERIQARFDADWGGSRGAPKFPRAQELEWLLDLACEPGSDGSMAGHNGLGCSAAAPGTNAHPARRLPSSRPDEAQRMACLTLQTMATHGLQDHLGGGFFRYCVDAQWTIPHFEKMLYDNAQLLPVYARAAVATDVDPALRATAQDAALGIVDWLAREMTAPNGAFYSSLDADSADGEGAFYLWTRGQMDTALETAERPLAEAAFGLAGEPNFEGRAWHLLRVTPIAELATRFGTGQEAIMMQLARVREHLFDARGRRPHPSRDDKRLTAWNALTISGLARAARLLDDARCAHMAQRALRALRDSAWIDDELYANAASFDQRVPGFLDDHALLLDALLESLQLAFSPVDLDWAIALADGLLTKFEDHDAGGFWFTTTVHGTPLARGRDFTDDALPNGNGVAIRSLLRLGHLLGRTDYLDAAERALGTAAAALAQFPDACPTLVRALREYADPRMQIVIRCAAAQKAPWSTALGEAGRGVDAAGDGTRDAFLIPIETGNLPGVLADRKPDTTYGAAWICQGMTCRAPVTSPPALIDALRGAPHRKGTNNHPS